MGAIMAVGVAVSNAIMLVSFADRHRREEGMPADRAAITAAKGRLRPIIMTGCAMIAGMIPMSLGLEEGSEQNAPLGRAVIGGMALATVATLLVLPAVFTLLLRPGLEPVALARPGRPGERALRPDPPDGTRLTAATRSRPATRPITAAEPISGGHPMREARLNRAARNRHAGTLACHRLGPLPDVLLAAGCEHSGEKRQRPARRPRGKSEAGADRRDQGRSMPSGATSE